MAKSMEEIAKLLQNTHFKRRVVGGVDEDDVWRKLQRLQKEYEELIQDLWQQNHGVIVEYRRRVEKLEKRNVELEMTVSDRPSGFPGENRTALQPATVNRYDTQTLSMDPQGRGYWDAQGCQVGES